jgi:hypothetical protein
MDATGSSVNEVGELPRLGVGAHSEPLDASKTAPLPPNRMLLSERLTDTTARHLLTLTASVESVSEMTKLIADAAAGRLADIEEECAEADVA